MRILFLILFSAMFGSNSSAQGTIINYLSGTDKDHTEKWDFYCTGGRNSGKWTTIPVPSNWELMGFGTYNYGHDKIKSDEQGLYKHEFFAGNWTGKKVFIVFEGSMTDTKVLINGQPAGPVHQGSFYRFKYDITDLLKLNAKNLLEVTVAKMSANPSVNDAERGNSDFWVFGGIFRPVYLEIVPETFISRLAINAKADGAFSMDVYSQNLRAGETIEARVQKCNGENVGPAFSAEADTTKEFTGLKTQFKAPLLWNAETPNLYQVSVAVKNKQRVIHRIIQKFGFRTVELRPNDGFYVNGVKVIMKGCNRHSFWPESGRTLSHAINLMDVGLMKEMNMNAVRMSHYPPDADFLDLCDSLGLYVLDELTGWQAKYDTVVGHKLVKELVVRDVNHPSVVFWDNGNEGGWNTGLDDDYRLYDPQNRTVLHPWANFNGADNHHYPDYNYLLKTTATGKDVFFPTEFMHGLYDGGAGAGLDDFWKEMLTYPHLGGGFIWAFLDEAVVRTDKDGAYDTDGNHAPDGILGPHREKEASYYTIKEIWSPVYIDPKPIERTFNGKLPVENRYAFTNLDKCRFKWQLVKLPSPRDKSTKALVTASGFPAPLDLAPGDKGTLKLQLPATWTKNDALYLTAYGPDQKKIVTWNWAIPSPAPAVKRYPIQNKIEWSETAKELQINCDGIVYYFDKTSGFIEKVVKRERTISLSGGPAPAAAPLGLKKFTYEGGKEQYTVQADYQGAAEFHVQWIFRPGHAVELKYSYNQTGDVDFAGITFNYPEEKITGMKWLGRGPYRVWKNRLKGQQYGVWQKDYNNTITGETWGYPEFKGYHAEIGWVVIQNKESPFTIYTADKNSYLQMLHPAREKDALNNNNVEPPFPTGSIGILNAISPIGTKFHAAKQMGPQGQKNQLTGEYTGTLWFDFTGD